MKRFISKNDILQSVHQSMPTAGKVIIKVFGAIKSPPFAPPSALVPREAFAGCPLEDDIVCLDSEAAVRTFWILTRKVDRLVIVATVRPCDTTGAIEIKNAAIEVNKIPIELKPSSYI